MFRALLKSQRFTSSVGHLHQLRISPFSQHAETLHFNNGVEVTEMDLLSNLRLETPLVVPIAVLVVG